MSKYKCPECGGDQVEEVMTGVTQTSVIERVYKLDGGILVMDYGNTSTEGGDVDDIRYQCVGCGNPVSNEDLEKMVEEE